MTFVITENCIQCKHHDCADVCPVDCFHETPLMLVIDPDECIDCTLCEPECPVEAIYSVDELPESQRQFAALNARLSRIYPPIHEIKGSLPTAYLWKNIAGKASLVASALADMDWVCTPEQEALYQRLATVPTLSSEEWENGLIDPDPVVRSLLATRGDFVLDRGRLNKGLTDANESVRGAYVYVGRHALTAADIDAILKDPSPGVRLTALNGRGSDLTANQLETALQDSEVTVRLRTITEPGFRPTEQQFLRTLDLGTPAEVSAMLARMTSALVPVALKHSSMLARAAACGFAAVSLSPEEVDAGIHDAEKQVRLAVVTRADFHPSVQQFETLLDSGDFEVVSVACKKASEACVDAAINHASPLVALVIREVAELTPAQMTRCLEDQRSDVALAALERSGQRLTKARFAICMRSPHEGVRYEAVSRYGISRLSAQQVDQCLSDPSSKLRKLIVSCDDIQLSANHTARALMDRATLVRTAVATRPDFLPTPAQFERGMADSSIKVRDLFSTRFRVVKGKVVDISKQRTAVGSKPADKLRQVLDEMAEISTWTRRKHQLREELNRLLEELGYLHSSVDARRAWVKQTGEHALIEVPRDTRGALKALAGKTAHVVCTGHGRYSTIYFAAKAV